MPFSVGRTRGGWLGGIIVALSLLLAGCRAGTSETAALTVAAAANVSFAFEEIGSRFEATSGAPITFVFGSTGTLTQQIENGAPFDVFAAADETHIDQLAAQELLLAETRHTYARGRLVLVVNRDKGLPIATLADLASPQVTRIAIANPEHAPYGLAARQTLQAAGLWETLSDKIVWAENVRQALQFVQTGDAPAGLVALSIADVPEVSVMTLSDELYQPIDQAMAALARSERPEMARQFVDFVLGAEGQAILQRYGYQTPGEF